MPTRLPLLDTAQCGTNPLTQISPSMTQPSQSLTPSELSQVGGIGQEGGRWVGRSEGRLGGREEERQGGMGDERKEWREGKMKGKERKVPFF